LVGGWGGGVSTKPEWIAGSAILDTPYLYPQETLLDILLFLRGELGSEISSQEQIEVMLS
jgi:hypothetical protein